MIKLFVSDMDGTLLNAQHLISQENASAIRDLQSAGIEFLIATGRSYNSASPLLKMHNLSPSMITLNGATFNQADGSVNYTHELLSDDIVQLIDYAQQEKLVYSIMTTSDYFLADHKGFIDKIKKMLSKKNIDHSSMSQFFVNTEYIHSIDDFSLNDEKPVCKMMILSRDEDAKKRFIDTFNDVSTIDITSSGPDNLEITHVNAQKGNALAQYAKEKGYQLEEILTIGDSLNDASMLAITPYSFAMENASEEIKRIAEFKAPHHDQHGVAQVIHSLLNGDYQKA